jgi:uncharacterized membrane protein YfcA
LSVVLVPILQLAIEPRAAVLVGIVSLFLIGLTDIGRIRRDADRSAFPLTGLALLSMPSGVWALTALPADWARVLIAGVSLGAFVLVVVPVGRIALARGPALALSGLATGFFGGFAGMPGPGMALFYLRGRLPPVSARASIMAIFLVVTPLSAIFFIALGVGSWRKAALASGLLPCVWLGDIIGHKAYGHVAARQWQASTATVLGEAALGAIWKLL